MINRAVQAILFVATAAVIGTLLYWQVDILNRGGPVMIPILMCSIFSLALSVERLVYFFRLRLGPASVRFLEDLRRAVAAQRWPEALGLCEGFPGPVARVVQAGLEDRQRAPQEIDETMRTAAHQEMPAIEQHLRWLSTLAQVSTLMGLLGTVTGLVRAFQVIQLKTGGGGPVSPGDLAGGVWEALITTVAGLTIAIPTILAYNYFASRVGDVQFQMETASDIVANWRRFGSKDAAR